MLKSTASFLSNILLGQHKFQRHWCKSCNWMLINMWQLRFWRKWKAYAWDDFFGDLNNKFQQQFCRLLWLYWLSETKWKKIFYLGLFFAKFFYTRFKHFIYNAQNNVTLFMRGDLSRATQLFQIELRLANWTFFFFFTTQFFTLDFDFVQNL